MRLALRGKLAAVAAALVASASACLWDSDTLAEEAKGKMDLVSTIVGRFERNPPLYYEMRLERVAKELERDPKNLGDYDDAAVACDRLGRHDEAIAWIEKKRAQLPPLEKSTPEQREHWYRYYANAGTFWAHRWFKNGADRKKIAELETGRDLIKKALEINPDAHFGREKYQLAIMEWVIREGKGEDGSRIPLDATLERQRVLPLASGDTSATELVTGLAGLIRLGNAWGSADVFHALASALVEERLGTLSYLAVLRYQELWSTGARSVVPPKNPNQPDSMFYRTGSSTSRQMNNFHRTQFSQLRKNADKWHEHRTEFMLARLKEGKHPDTHKDFWDGYIEVPSMALAQPPIWITPDAQMFLVIGILLATLLSVIFITRRVVRIIRRPAR